MKEVCVIRKLMSPRTFQENLNAAVSRGLISKTPDMRGKVRRTWYSIWLDFDKKEVQMATIFESKLIEFDRLFETLAEKANRQSVHDRGVLIYLFEKRLHNLRNVARFYQEGYFADSSAFSAIEKSLTKRERALKALARKGNLKTRRNTLNIISFYSMSENSAILDELQELLKP